MTIQEMAKMAVDVQNACNLSGIVRTFHEITQAMRLEHGMDTRTCNEHPICRLFISKMCDLSGFDCDNVHEYGRALAEVERLAQTTEHGIRG